MTAVRVPVAAILLAAGTSACGSEPTIVPVRNLDRPSDVAFVCVGAYQTGGGALISGRPMAECRPGDGPDPPAYLDKERLRGTFAIITNTARGELAVVDLDGGAAAPARFRRRLVDLDPEIPGFNMLPVGLLPEALAATQDGCLIATANRGSCDLSLVDAARLVVDGGFGGRTPSSGNGPVVETLAVTTASGRPLGAAPGEVVFLPQDTRALRMAEGLCSSGGTWRALVSFPTCDLVALVEIQRRGAAASLARILSSVRIGADGAVTAGDDPTCPASCRGAPRTAADRRDGGGDADAGIGAAAAALEPGALALTPEGGRAYVGAATAPFITALDVKGGATLTVPAGGGRIVLAGGAGGVTRLRLSVDPFRPDDKDGSVLGSFVGGRGEFLYAFARDGSVRVIDVGQRRAQELPERECEVNVDPLSLPATTMRTQGCFPVGPTARRPLAMGPGLRLPPVAPNVAPPVPRDIAFAHLGSRASVAERLEDVPVGAFGFLLASNGHVYLVNVDPNTRPDEIAFTHSLRDLNAGLAEGLRGPPRVSPGPSRSFATGDLPFPTRITLASNQGPRVEGVPTTEPEANPLASPERPASLWALFPDRTGATPQRWSIVLQDVLPGTERATGIVSGPASAAPAGAIEDLGADHCKSGVLPGDIAVLSGCREDADCGPDGQTLCQQTAPPAPGLCFPKLGADAREDPLLRRCGRHLASRRRYRVLRASRTRLDLGLLPDEVQRPAIAPCRIDHPEDCQPAAAFRSLGAGDPGFECVALREGEPPRCVKRCLGRDAAGQPAKDDRLCRLGFVCEDLAGTLPGAGPLCVEGPALDAACWPDATAYRAHAGHAFLVSGSGTPWFQAVREAEGECRSDPARHRLLANRIPLDAARCTNIADGTDSLTALRLDPEGGNPCLFVGPNGDEPGAPSHVKALFRNHELRLLLTNLEEYVGDAVAIRFPVLGGFFPARVPDRTDIILTFPVRIVTGPNDTLESWRDGNPGFPYFYVIDQGRSVTAVGGRGQFLRLNPRAGSASAPRFDSNNSPEDPFQIQ